MAGKRINLSELADEPPLDARVPAFAEHAFRTVRVDQLAVNPLNTRDVYADPAKITSIADSLRVHGQLQPCTVVSRAAFLHIFPEHESVVGEKPFVQVTGARRRAAAIEADLPTLDVTIKNNLAESRALFVSATAAENIDREDYNPIEEAKAIQLLVKECGSGKAAAEQMSRTPGWVTQRLNLLKLAPQIQAAVRAREVPLREVRDLHKLAVDEQVEALTAWRQRQTEPGFTAVNHEEGGSGAESPPQQRGTQPRLSPVAAAIRRLGETPPKIAESLRGALEPEQLRELVELLQRPS